MKITSNWIKENVVGVDSCSKRDGVFTARKGFFYTFAGTSEKFAETIKAAFPNAKIIEHGEHWAPFRGGASVAESSHWWVKFTMEDA